MDDCREIKMSLLTPECLSQPDGNKVLCLSHRKTISSDPILGILGFGICSQFGLCKRRSSRKESTVEREGKVISLSILTSPLLVTAGRSEEVSVSEGLVHLTGPWFLLRTCFLRETTLLPQDYELLESRNPSSPSHRCLMGTLSASLVPGRTGAP